MINSEYILHPPVPEMTNNLEETYKFLLEIWKRTGGYTAFEPVDLKGLSVNADELNTLDGIRTDTTVQYQINGLGHNINLGVIAYGKRVDFWTMPLLFSSNVASIQKASSTSDGYLTSIDWNTFNNKEGPSPPGTIYQYWRGDKTWQTLDTDAVVETGNLYFTDLRARTAISNTVTGLTYTTFTGVLSLTTGYIIPTTTEESNWNDAYSKRVDTWNSPLGFSTNIASIQVANSIQDGYLTSIDWNIFNNKLSPGNYITALTGDVSATGPGSASSTVNSVGTSSAANIHSAELLANAATAINTSSTIVKRDASGMTSVSLRDDNVTPKISLNHNTRICLDSTEVNSIDWNNRLGFDSSGNKVINWSGSSTSIYDTAGTAVQFSFDRTTGIESLKGLILNGGETLTQYRFVTLTRFATGIWPFDPVVSVKAEIIGYTVTLRFPEVLGTADTASYITISTLPVTERPLVNLQMFIPRTVDNGVDSSTPSLITISTAGVIRIYSGAGNFAGSGNSGFRPFSITYSVG